MNVVIKTRNYQEKSTI